MHIFTCPTLSSKRGIRHGFFGREGGVSSGIYASLNCGPGSGDDLGNVAQNRARVAHALGQSPHTLITCHQIHSATSLSVAAPWKMEEAPKADAIVTRTPAIVLGVLTADCLPVLFADAKNHVIAAAHAGWKGAISGILEATIGEMGKLGAEKSEISATIGPAIAQGSYEVGAEFIARFIEEKPSNSQYFIPSKRAGHFMFNLPAYASEKLKLAGIATINVLAHDTCLEENRLFSFRRSTLRGEPVYGRQVSAIVLENE